MIDHFGYQVSDPKKARAFYDSALGALGYKMLMEVPKEYTGGVMVIGYGADRAQFWITEGAATKPTSHTCFEAATRTAVDSFYKAAMAAGGTDNGAPGIRKEYGPTYYAAFVRDPDGNNVEACCRKPE